MMRFEFRHGDTSWRCNSYTSADVAHVDIVIDHLEKTIIKSRYERDGEVAYQAMFPRGDGNKVLTAPLAFFDDETGEKL